MGYTVRTKDDPGDVGRSADQQESVDNDIYFKSLLCFVQLEIFNWAAEVSAVVGDGAAYLPGIPAELDGRSLIGIHAQVRNAGVTNLLEIALYNVTQAVDMLSTNVTIDSTETDSSTAAAPAVIKSNGDEELAAYDVLRIDIDAIHDTPSEGLVVTLRFG